METWKLNEIWYATSQTAKVYPNDTSNPITFGPFFPIVAVVEMSALESFSFLKRGKISLLPFRCKDKETTCHESVCESHLRRQVEALSFITEERHLVVQRWGTSWCKGEMGLLFLYLSKRWSILRRLLYVTLGPLIILEYDVLRRLVGRMAKRNTYCTYLHVVHVKKWKHWIGSLIVGPCSIDFVSSFHSESWPYVKQLINCGKAWMRSLTIRKIWHLKIESFSWRP